MTALSCFLRAINVGKRRVPMAELRALVEELGFSDVKTLLNSGNVVFTGKKSADAARKLLEPALEEKFGFQVDCVVKSIDELKAILDGNPFPKGKPEQVVIILTQKPVKAAAVDTILEKNKGPEKPAIVDGNLFIHYPNGLGQSKLTATLIDKATGMPGTARNMNTIQKVIALAGK